MISDLGTLMIKGQAIRRLSTVHCLFSFALPYPSRSCILRCRHSLALPYTTIQRRLHPASACYAH